MTPRRWLVLGVAMALVGALVAGTGLFYGNFSPRGYVKDRYTRAPGHDIGRDSIAYTSSQPPSRVAQNITHTWRPANRYTDATGYYLRYSDDSVVILPLAAGSLILLERMGTAYARYHNVVGSSWGASRGNTVRGGGPGAGK